MDASDTGRDTVKVLGKGIQVLAELNRHNGLSVLALSERVRLPRPTVARIISTLEGAGYVYRCPADRHYRVAAQVRRLSNGYSAARWLQTEASTVADELSAQLAWPAMVAQFEDRRIRLVYLTDKRTTMIAERATLGDEIPLLDSALGLCYLAFGSDQPVEDMLEATSGEHGLDQAERIAALRQTESLIAQGREQGFIVFAKPGRTAIAAPIEYVGKAVAAIGLRIPLSIDRLGAAQDEICTAVRDAARQITAALADR